MTISTPRQTRRSPAARGPRPSVRHLAATAAAGAVLLAVVAGCDGGDRAAQVASLPAAPTAQDASPLAGAAASGASTDQAAGSGGRPQMRIDDTPERRAALIRAWDQCLLDHGAQQDVGRAAAVGTDGGDTLSIIEPIPTEARAACTQLLPLGPPELDPTRNPHYRDDWLGFVACMREHGMPVHLAKDTSVDPHGLTYTYDSDHAAVPSDAAQIEQDCTQSVFGGE